LCPANRVPMKAGRLGMMARALSFSGLYSGDFAPLPVWLVILAGREGCECAVRRRLLARILEIKGLREYPVRYNPPFPPISPDLPAKCGPCHTNARLTHWEGADGVSEASS